MKRARSLRRFHLMREIAIKNKNPLDLMLPSNIHPLRTPCCRGNVLYPDVTIIIEARCSLILDSRFPVLPSHSQALRFELFVFCPHCKSHRLGLCICNPSWVSQKPVSSFYSNKLVISLPLFPNIGGGEGAKYIMTASPVLISNLELASFCFLGFNNDSINFSDISASKKGPFSP